MSELQQLFQHLKQLGYVHVLLNPLPVYATAMGVLALVIALLMRNRHAQVVALIVVFVGCASAWVVVRTGQRGYDRVYAMSNNDAQKWLDVHQKRADQFIYAFYATGLLALATLAAHWRFAKAMKPLAVATLIAAAASVGIGGWIGHAGGQVRRSEFREGPPPSRVERPRTPSLNEVEYEPIQTRCGLENSVGDFFQQHQTQTLYERQYS